MNEGDKIGTLSAAGFTNQEIARLLGKDTNAVKQALFQKRKRGSKPKKRKK
jgi:DNA-directed RNA polymerase specialized sigma24 family protein